MQLIKEWEDDEVVRVVLAKIYGKVSKEDFTSLRNQAAGWSFGRSLTDLEQNAIVEATQIREPGLIVLRTAPLIEIKTNNSRLVREQYGLVPGRVGAIFYHAGQIENGLVRVSLFDYKRGSAEFPRN